MDIIGIIKRAQLWANETEKNRKMDECSTAGRRARHMRPNPPSEELFPVAALTSSIDINIIIHSHDRSIDNAQRSMNKYIYRIFFKYMYCSTIVHKP